MQPATAMAIKEIALDDAGAKTAVRKPQASYTSKKTLKKRYLEAWDRPERPMAYPIPQNKKNNKFECRETSPD